MNCPACGKPLDAHHIVNAHEREFCSLECADVPPADWRAPPGDWRENIANHVAQKLVPELVPDAVTKPLAFGSALRM